MKFLVDSDFLVALYKPDDSNNKKGKEIFKKVQGEELVALNLVFQESATVISKKMGMDYARKFYFAISRIIKIKIMMELELERLSWAIFLRQMKRGTSFIDCANLAAMKEYKFDGILSFDEFYPERMRTK